MNGEPAKTAGTHRFIGALIADNSPVDENR